EPRPDSSVGRASGCKPEGPGFNSWSGHLSTFITSRGEIKGKKKNIPWAVFNGVGHSIYKKVPKDYLPWVECQPSVKPKLDIAPFWRSWFSGWSVPNIWQGVDRVSVVKSARLISRLQNNDNGDEEEDEGEAPEGQEAKEQDEEDALESSPATGDYVSEQAEEELDDRDDSEESAVDTMPPK
ncbi:hypothetical protein V8D89_016353, partial [Ganoderma adspersum]